MTFKHLPKSWVSVPPLTPPSFSCPICRQQRVDSSPVTKQPSLSCHAITRKPGKGSYTRFVFGPTLPFPWKLPFLCTSPTLIAHVWAQAPSSAIRNFLALSQLEFQYLVCLLPICPLSWSSREPSERPIYFVTPLLKAYPWFLIDLEFSPDSFAMQLRSFTTWFLQTHVWHFLPGILCSTPVCLLRAPESPMCYLTLRPLHLWFSPSGMPPSLHPSPLLGLRFWP